MLFKVHPVPKEGDWVVHIDDKVYRTPKVVINSLLTYSKQCKPGDPEDGCSLFWLEGHGNNYSNQDNVFILS